MPLVYNRAPRPLSRATALAGAGVPTGHAGVVAASLGYPEGGEPY